MPLIFDRLKTRQVVEGLPFRDVCYCTYSDGVTHATLGRSARISTAAYVHQSKSMPVLTDGQAPMRCAEISVQTRPERAKFQPQQALFHAKGFNGRHRSGSPGLVFTPGTLLECL